MSTNKEVIDAYLSGYRFGFKNGLAARRTTEDELLGSILFRQQLEAEKAQKMRLVRRFVDKVLLVR